MKFVLTLLSKWSLFLQQIQNIRDEKSAFELLAMIVQKIPKTWAVALVYDDLPEVGGRFILPDPPYNSNTGTRGLKLLPED